MVQSERGQATVDYVALLGLVALLLAVGGAAVTVTGVGDGCSTRCARASAPSVACCVRRRRSRASCGVTPQRDNGSITIGVVRLGEDQALVVERLSNGKVAVTLIGGGHAGGEVGIGAGGSVATGSDALGTGAEARAAVIARLGDGREWIFPSEAAARRLIDQLGQNETIPLLDGPGPGDRRPLRRRRGRARPRRRVGRGRHRRGRERRGRCGARDGERPRRDRRVRRHSHGPPHRTAHVLPAARRGLERRVEREADRRGRRRVRGHVGRRHLRPARQARRAARPPPFASSRAACSCRRAWRRAGCSRTPLRTAGSAAGSRSTRDRPDRTRQRRGDQAPARRPRPSRQPGSAGPGRRGAGRAHRERGAAGRARVRDDQRHVRRRRPGTGRRRRGRQPRAPDGAEHAARCVGAPAGRGLGRPARLHGCRERLAA